MSGGDFCTARALVLEYNGAPSSVTNFAAGVPPLLKPSDSPSDAPDDSSNRGQSDQQDVERTDETSAKWQLTSEAFQKLLACFSLDPEEAAREYELARRNLIRFFEWRSVPDADNWTDETINRAARRIDEGQKIENLMAYLYGIARRILKEVDRYRDRSPKPLDEVTKNIKAKESEIIEPDARQVCFDRCLEELSGKDRDLILDYFQSEGGAKIRSRQGIADRLGIPLNALRIRVHRIRKTLENCISECLQVKLARND